MSMVFCRACGNQIHSSATTCPHCGAPQTPAKAPGARRSYVQKLHLTMAISALLCVLLLYTTHAIGLISILNGLALGLSIALFLEHKREGFVKPRKIDWIVLVVFGAAAFGAMLVKQYQIEALLMIVMGVRSLMLYFSTYSPKADKDAAT